MVTKQQQLDKKIRKLMSNSIKTLPIEKIEEVFPKLIGWLKQTYAQPSHSRWYWEDLEKEIDKEMKHYI